MGQGETLQAFSQIIGINAAHSATFSNLMKSNFSTLSATSSSLDFIAQVDKIVASHPELLS